MAGTDGVLRAVLFGYACHNTTTGGDFYQVNGDYAGVAQLELEKTHPGTIAMFMMLCGSDQNPNPRGTVELADQYGQALAAAVRTDAGRRDERRFALPSGRPIGPSIWSSLRTRASNFRPSRRTPTNIRQRRARLMLEAYDQGRPFES